MKFATIRWEELPDGIGRCTLDRPEARNALNVEMVEELRTLFLRLVDDVRPKVVIFAGAGEKIFVSGADIRELRDRRAADALARINASLFRELEQLPFPTIAAIRGAALGGGLEFAMACDLRVCAEDSKLGQPEVALGIIPGAGATYRLPRLVGLGRAKDLIFTGRLCDGREAGAMGLVNRVVPADRVLEEAQNLASRIAANGELAVRLAKVALGAGSDAGTEAGMALESSLQAVLFDDPEKIERMTRFLKE